MNNVNLFCDAKGGTVLAFYVNSLRVGFFSESRAPHCLVYIKSSNIFSTVKPEKVKM